MVILTRKEWGKIKDIKELDLQTCSFCGKINILNLGWRAFGKFNCNNCEKKHVLCWELCYKYCLNILGCELLKKREESTARNTAITVNQEYYRASCYLCSKELQGAGKHGIIKNRNNPLFWGVKSVYKILCLECLGKRHYFRLSDSKKRTFRKYLKRGYE